MKALNFLGAGLFAILLTANITAFAQNFIHPGILHSKEDLDRMKKAVAAKEEPIYSGFRVFAENPVSSSSYKMQGPLESVGRNPTVGQTIYDSDANAAHQNAVMWAITGDKAYAEKAIEILNAWCSTLKTITGRDAVLMAGLGPFKMVNAAEIIRYTNAGWKAGDIRKAEEHFKEIIYPVIKDFAPFANGNWEAAAMKTVMSIGVFCNDREIFERALKYYVAGAGNGRLTHYVINEDGQIQESGRDQGHTQLGVAMLAECSEIAWHQGLNLYGYADDRLLKGFEYVAKFNLGNEVPFVETLDRTGKYHHKAIARQDRGPLRAIYEQVYNHYVNRMGLQAPFTKQAAEKIRPEGPGKPGADHPGYGTLFFTQPKTARPVSDNKAPVAPAGIIAKAADKNINISWIAPVGANSYAVSRSEKAGGPYSIIARNIRTTAYTDKTVKAGKLYYYTIKAFNSQGESQPSLEVSITAGLPGLWKQTDVGKVAGAGITQFNGREFVVKAYGSGIDSLAESFHYGYIPLTGNVEVTVRYVPQISSQFSSFGISLRSDTAAGAAHVSLTLNPGKTEQIEAPNWHVRLLEKKQTDRPAKTVKVNQPLPEATVTYGRMTGYYWLRLRRTGKTVSAFVSPDGKEWTSGGTTSFSDAKPVYIGLVVASGMPNCTVVKFDKVTIRTSK